MISHLLSSASSKRPVAVNQGSLSSMRIQGTKLSSSDGYQPPVGCIAFHVHVANKGVGKACKQLSMSAALKLMPSVAVSHPSWRLGGYQIDTNGQVDSHNRGTPAKVRSMLFQPRAIG